MALGHYRIDVPDNRIARRIRTQVLILRRVAVVGGGYSAATTVRALLAADREDPAALLHKALESLRVWHGVIFVRKGVYQGGVFKFRVDLPPEYPELDAWPRVTFVVARVFNPLVHEESGALDVRGCAVERDASRDVRDPWSDRGPEK